MPPDANLPAKPTAKSSRRATVRWTAAPEFSAAWATYVVATSAPCTDPKTEALLITPVADINSRLLSASIDVSKFWNQYLDERLADQELATAAMSSLMVAGCNEMQLDQIAKTVANRLTDARAAFLGRYPKLAEQLDLRGRPLRERWDMYGEGLLRGVERQIWNNSPPEDWWTTRTAGWLVQPLVGGHGGMGPIGDGSPGRLWPGQSSPSQSWPGHSSPVQSSPGQSWPGQSWPGHFWIEAMLTDADPAVPEVLRVAWLMTSLAIENHTRGRSTDTGLMLPWQYASVPLVLAAAADVELVGGPELPIERAMATWKFGDAATAKKVAAWWRDFTANPEPLPVALRRLAV